MVFLWLSYGSPLKIGDLPEGNWDLSPQLVKLTLRCSASPQAQNGPKKTESAFAPIMSTSRGNF